MAAFLPTASWNTAVTPCGQCCLHPPSSPPWTLGSPALLPEPSRLGTVHPSCLHPGAQQSASSGTWQMNELDELSKSCSSSVQICAGYHGAPQEPPCPPLPGECGGTGWLLVPALTLEGARLDTLLCPELSEGQVERGRPLGGGRKGTWAGPWVCFWPCFFFSLFNLSFIVAH